MLFIESAEMDVTCDLLVETQSQIFFLDIDMAKAVVCGLASLKRRGTLLVLVQMLVDVDIWSHWQVIVLNISDKDPTV